MGDGYYPLQDYPTTLLLFFFWQLPFLFETIKQVLHPVHLVQRFVDVEGDFGDPTNLLAQAVGQGAFQALVLFFHLEDDGLFVIRIPDTDVNLGLAQIGRGLDLGNGHQRLRAVDVGAFLLKYDAEIALYQFGYLPLSFTFHALNNGISTP